MVSDAPSSAWHPALMPHTIADLPQAPAADSISSPTVPRDIDTAELEQTNTLRQPEDTTDADPEAGAWFQDDGTGDDDWLADASNDPEPESQPEQPAAAPPVDSSADDALPDEPTTASKHLSTMSFTRTVPHEVNWNDDDDAEWNLSRTNTDPFKFMPENNRTNSFPPMPESEDATNEHPHELEQPISFDPAEELIREIEEEDTREEEALPDATSGSQDDTAAHDREGQAAVEPYPESGLESAAGDSAEARFEEGVPLVPAAEQEQDTTQEQPSSQAEPDFFGEEAGEEDDFFSQVNTGEAPNQEEPQPAPLQRKSTMEVLSSLNVGSAGSSFAPLEGTVEEADAESGDNTPIEQTRGEETAEPAAEENLDEKWKAMFGDEDEEGFLPDESVGAPEAPEVDASAFLGSDDEGLLDDSETEQPDEPSRVIASSRYAPAPTLSTQGVQGYFPQQQQQLQTPVNTMAPPNPYLPTNTPVTPATPANPYAAVGAGSIVSSPATTPYAAPSTGHPPPSQFGLGAPPLLQEKSKAQSFADKAKGGYTSPYDLPMEVVKPKRRTSGHASQYGPSAPASPASLPPPPRSVSMHQPPMPPPSSSHALAAAAAASSRPSSSHGSSSTLQPPPAVGVRKLASQENFFEDLPMTAKPRPASRQSQKSMPSPTQPGPYGVPPHSAGLPSVTSHPVAPVPPPGPGPVPSAYPPSGTGTGSSGASGPSGISGLVAPPRLDPYASLSAAPSLVPAAPPAASSTRYSPAPPGAANTNGPVPVPIPAATRYSPAPPASRQPSAGYGPTPTTPGPPILPHQPRTSSPLAHFEITHDKARGPAPESGLSERRSSSSLHEHRLQRVPSLPPTREVVEEEEPPAPARPQTSSGSSPPVSATSSKYAPAPPALKRATSNYSPLAPAYDFAPPPRSQTQSPGALYGGNRGGLKPAAEPIPRPSSVNDPTSAREAAYPLGPAPAPRTGPTPAAASVSAPTQGTTTFTRARGASLYLNVIPPTDGRENDPLKRWRGAPLVSWGVGGTFVTMFPKEVPRYGTNSSIPAVVRSPGQVKVQNVKEILPLEERLAKFPGPLKGKGKKKETVAWLTAGIEGLERDLPTTGYAQAGGFSPAYNAQVDKQVAERASERVLLWKILRVFVEHDGVLEGNAAVEKAVREVLSPNLGGGGGDVSASATPYLQGHGSQSQVQSDAVSASTLEQIRQHLLSGDCEKAVWAAADQRLWGHALLLSNALAPALYKQVAQEFVKKEVNVPGHGHESLAALYGVLSGNHEESVDELVPSHARAGLQLMATTNANNANANNANANAADGLDKWRETLGLVLSNRSADDARAIHALGVLLAGYGRAEAAQVCFLFARSPAHTVFGALDDPAAPSAKDLEPLLLGEVYEYGQSLQALAGTTTTTGNITGLSGSGAASGSTAAAGLVGLPGTHAHLAAYKLQHALVLAESGFRDKALQYCDALATAITAQTKRSPYHHVILEQAVEDLLRRLKQAPKEDSGSWIPKPSMNKVSDSVWSRFNKFVSGDDDGSGEGHGQGHAADGEVGPGPFGRVAGGTPTISRTPSVTNLETYGVAALPGYGGLPPATASSTTPMSTSAPPAPTRAASRYAPGAPPSTTGSASNSRPSTAAYAPAGAGGSPYAPRSSMERTSGEYSRGGSFEVPRRSLEMQGAGAGRTGSYSPVRAGSPLGSSSPYLPAAAGFQPVAPPAAAAPAPVPGAGAVPATIASPHTPASAFSPSIGYPGTAPSSVGYPMPSDSAGQSPEASGYQPPSYGYEPPSFTPYEGPSTSTPGEEATPGTETSSYEPPSYQPYSYEPPSYEPDLPATEDAAGSNEDDNDEKPKPKPKKKGIMYDDDDDDFPTPRPAEKSKAEKDRENEEMFRRAAEEDAKRAEAAKQAPKKGWGFTSWFGGAKKDGLDGSSSPSQNGSSGASNPNKPIRAKLGEANSFYYDPELKRWVNKNAGPEDLVKKATPPPPRSSGGGSPRSVSASPALGAAAGVDGRPHTSDGPPRAGGGGGMSGMSLGDSLVPPPPGPVAMLRSVSNTSTASAPPLGQHTSAFGTTGPGGRPPRSSSRPPTSLSNSSSIDDLLSAAGPRKPGAAKKAKRGARYVDVMGKT
ncbi:putative COPII coat assembly protein sec-16 [Dichotomopilus funicola]|uniref:Protein transport protein sec16 n=1 Tax=Dichotomopilus funicola TaxID=1934379 RepID=A0AAN6ZQM5_9PEZI|nr:putative COPII coat assembly protein sec-16 [Dichotomopilus funicola]